jgi:hypothetical protein
MGHYGRNWVNKVFLYRHLSPILVMPGPPNAGALFLIDDITGPEYGVFMVKTLNFRQKTAVAPTSVKA